MVDLHIHSTESDGTDSPEEILRKAEKLDLKIISFTDHECVNAHRIIKEKGLAKTFPGKIITGVELKSCYQGRVVDILGYGIDIEKIQDFLDKTYKGKTHRILQTKYMKAFHDRAKKLNLEVTPIDELDWNPDKDWASITFYQDLKKYEGNYEKIPQYLSSDFETFRNHYHGNDTLFYIDKTGDYPDPKEVIENIHLAGGKAFVAHIYRYRWIENKINYLEEFVNKFPIDGIESFYSTFTKEESDSLLEFTKKHNLLVSGGSDYHGLKKPNIFLGMDYDHEKYLTWIKKENY